MAHETKAQIMSDVQGEHDSGRVVANNTVEYHRPDGTRVIRLHHTDVVEFLPDGRIKLNSGGWRTVTTSERINRYLPPGWSLYSDRGTWYVSRRFSSREENSRFIFHDGMHINPDETTDAQPFDLEHAKAQRKETRAIRAYAKRYMTALKAGEVPEPGPGDCWFCAMRGKDGGTWGEMNRGSDDPEHHIRAHIEENYYVPSLIVRAAEVMGVSKAAWWTLGSFWKGQDVPDFYTGIGAQQLEKALYRYCAQQLGHQA